MERDNHVYLVLCHIQFFPNIPFLFCKNWITINKDSGVMTVGEQLDREKAQQLVLTVLVNDTRAEQNAPQLDTG